MVDVPTEVEGQVLLVEEDGGVVAGRACLLQLGQRVVGALHIRRVVFAVVELVDLPGDVRFQRTVVVIQVGQGVFSHGVPSSW